MNYLRIDPESCNPLVIHITTGAIAFFYFSLDGQLKLLKDSGFDVIVAANPDDRLDSFAQKVSVPALGIKMKRAISPFYDLFSIFSAWKAFRKLNPKIVHAHTPKGGLVGMLASFFANVSVRCYHVHGLPYMTAKGIPRFLLMSAEKLSCRLAHRVYFVSDSIKNVALADGLCQQQKAEILCNGSASGVDAAQRFDPANYIREEVRREMGIAADALVIGYIGRIVNDKGIKELMAAWNELKAQHADLFLLMAGTIEEKDRIPASVEDQILHDERICYVGEVEDTAPLFSAIDVFAFPSHREGFGTVVIEAGAMRVPVVGTKIPGCVDAVQDGVTGVLVPPQDESALRRALNTYLLDSRLREKHGKNGRARVLVDFCPEEIWKAQYESYLQLLSS